MRPPWRRRAPGLLVYDGECAFCRSCAAWVVARFRPGTGIARPWQDTDLAGIGLSPADTSAAVWWVPSAGQPVAGHLAVAAALRACHLPWRWFGWVLGRRIFAPLAAPTYAWVSRHRGTISRASRRIQRIRG